MTDATLTEALKEGLRFRAKRHNDIAHFRTSASGFY